MAKLDSGRDMGTRCGEPSALLVLNPTRTRWLVVTVVKHVFARSTVELLCWYTSPMILNYLCRPLGRAKELDLKDTSSYGDWTYD